MENNFSDFPQSLRTNTQTPLDAKSMVSTLDELKDLGYQDYKAFTYYNGMIVSCLENGRWYLWTDNLNGQEKLLEEDFVYPAGIVYGGYSYEGKAFNFVNFIKDGKDGKDGVDGKDGIDGKDGKDGIDGANATPKYTWTVYADDSRGRGLTFYPIGQNGEPKEYIGVLANQDTPTPSTEPSLYQFVKYIGDQGIPGANGYMWIKYSMYPKGRDGSGDIKTHDDAYDETINEYMVYMGVAYNKETQQEINIPELYTWSKIRGDDGHTGYLLDLSNDNVTIPTNFEGNIVGPTALRTAQTEVRLFYGNDIQPQEEYYIEIIKDPTTLDIVLLEGENFDDTYSVYQLNSIFDGDTASAKFIAKSNYDNEVLANGTFSISKAKGLASYSLVPSVQVIKIQPAVGDNPLVVTPKSITFTVYKNDGNTIVEHDSGFIKYKTNKSAVNGSLSINQSFSLTDYDDLDYIKFEYYLSENDENPSDIETIPIVRDGEPGADGQDGADGADGAPGPPGEAGKDGEPGPVGPFLAPMGRWKANVVYVGNSKRREAVLYESKWYVTLITAGNIPAGILPTNERYWLESDQTYEFIATDLLLAQTAYIENLGVRSLRTNDTGERIEILEDTNSMKFYLDNRKNFAISIGASSIGGNVIGTNSVETAEIAVQGKAKGESDSFSSITNSGVFSNGSNTYFIAPSAGTLNSASIVGIYNIDTETDDPVQEYNGTQLGRSGSFRAAVAGVHQSLSNEGRTFGGYFNNLYTGSTSKKYEEVVVRPTPHAANIHTTTYLCMSNSGVMQIQLPLMGTKSSTSNTWNSNANVMFEIDVILVYDNADVKVISSNGAVIIDRSGNLVSTFTQSARGTLKLAWIGNYWIILN